MYSEVQAIMGIGHMGPPPPCEQKNALKTLPSRNFVGSGGST